MELTIISSLIILIVIASVKAIPFGCDCGIQQQQQQQPCPPPPLPACPQPVICAPQICPQPIPCPILPPLPPPPPIPQFLPPPLPCPTLCLPTPPMLFAENSCCTGCLNQCSFRSRKRREVSAQAFAKALRNLNDDPICNNDALKQIIKQNATDDAWSTKEMIQKAVAEKYPSIQYNVICAAGDLAYTAQTHDFCLAQQNNISCYVFRPL